MKASSRTAINLLFVGVGLIALGLLIAQVGAARLASQLWQVGSVFWLVLLVELLSNATSCRGWLHTFPRDDRPGYGRLLLTGLASLSVAGILPSGQSGELAKANLLRGHAHPTTIVSSLLFFNYLHMLSTGVVVLVGALLGVMSARFPSPAAECTLALGLVVLVGTLGLGALLRLRITERVLGWTSRIPVRRLRPSAAWLDGARRIDRSLIAFHRPDLLRAMFWLTLGRLLQVLEAYIVLRSLTLPCGLADVSMVYAATSLANYLLMVLPAREGFLEGSSYVVFGMLGMSAAGGLSFEVVRRLRKLVYQSLGLVLMMGMSRSTKKPPETGGSHGEHDGGIGRSGVMPGAIRSGG